MCGNNFPRPSAAESCHKGCPMGSHCNLVMCPACGYEWPGDSRLVNWLKRLLGVTHAKPPGEVTEQMMVKLKVRK